MPADAPVNEIGYAASNGVWSYYDEEPTPELRWPNSVGVYDAMRSGDAQVGSVLRAVTLPIRRTPWRVEQGDASDEVTAFVADDLGLPILGGGEPDAPQPRTRDRFSWPEHLQLALLMLPFGHMFFEQQYRVTDGGSRAHLRKLGPRLPRTIQEVKVAPDGGLISIRQVPVGTQQNQPIPVDRLVAYVHEREGGNWLGRSVLRNCYKNWLLKDQALRTGAQTIERNGLGVPRYTGPEEPAPDDLAKGLAMAKAWRAGVNAGVAIPYGAHMDLVGVSGTLPDALPFIQYQDEQIARAVLAHFLNLGTQTGSWALGTTFADFFTLSLQTLAQQVADVATQHIIEDIVDVNWGPDEAAPRLVFQEIGSRREASADAIKVLVDSGVIRTDRDLEEFVRDVFGLPGKGLPSPSAAPPALPAPDSAPTAPPAQDGGAP
jgi:hypothetical protein